MLFTLKKLTVDNAYLLLTLCMLGWAGNAIAGRLSSGEISPMVIVFLRWAIVSSLLFTLRAPTIVNSLPSLNGKIVWVFLMGGIGYTGFNSLFYIAAQSTTAINLGIIQGVMPAMILVGSVIIFREKTNIFGFVYFRFSNILDSGSKNWPCSSSESNSM